MYKLRLGDQKGAPGTEEDRTEVSSSSFDSGVLNRRRGRGNEVEFRREQKGRDFNEEKVKRRNTLRTRYRVGK